MTDLLSPTVHVSKSSRVRHHNRFTLSDRSRRTATQRNEQRKKICYDQENLCYQQEDSKNGLRGFSRQNVSYRKLYHGKSTTRLTILPLLQSRAETCGRTEQTKFGEGTLYSCPVHSTFPVATLKRKTPIESESWFAVISHCPEPSN